MFDQKDSYYDSKWDYILIITCFNYKKPIGLFENAIMLR